MLTRVALSALLAALLSACATEKGAVNKVVFSDVNPLEASKPGVAPAPNQVEADALSDPKSVLAGRSVYYPFDVDVVQAADKPLVEAHAKYLASHANRSVKLEGNCDERGSNEYNLGLGQRRADGVKKMLVLGGAKEGQLSAVSYGEEKPRCTTHSEECWSQNRRSDLNYAK